MSAAPHLLTSAHADQLLAWHAADWAVRIHAPAFLAAAGLTEPAAELAALPCVTPENAPAALAHLAALKPEVAALAAGAVWPLHGWTTAQGAGVHAAVRAASRVCGLPTRLVMAATAIGGHAAIAAHEAGRSISDAAAHAVREAEHLGLIPPQRWLPSAPPESEVIS